jgi:hypothetical protein
VSDFTTRLDPRVQSAPHGATRRVKLTNHFTRRRGFNSPKSCRRAQRVVNQVEQVRGVIVKYRLAGGSDAKYEWKDEIIIYWSKADQAYIAEVPELPGCAADEATYSEAVANAEVARLRPARSTPSRTKLTHTTAPLKCSRRGSA